MLPLSFYYNKWEVFMSNTTADIRILRELKRAAKAYRNLMNIQIDLNDKFHSDLLMLHGVNTANYIIPKGVTNLDFVLGLDVNNDINNKKVNDNLVPYTLRVDDEESFFKSREQFQVDFIF